MNYKLGIVLIGGLALASCRGNDADKSVLDSSASISFTVEGRAGDDTSAASGLLTRLYVAHLAQEQEAVDGINLYCSEKDRYFLSENEGAWSYRLENLVARWYKFAFVGVPDNQDIDGKVLFTEENEGENTSDFTRLMIDYVPVMEYQKNHCTVFGKESGAEVDFKKEGLSIYRKVINRWLVAGESLTETGLVMSRINGGLSFDMGILSDQFEKSVSQISVSLDDVPERIYIYDNASQEDQGSVIVGENKSSYTFVYEVSSNLQNSRSLHCCFDLAMLPGNVSGQITVTYTDDTSDSYKITTDSEAIVVKPNTCTTVLFNGMTSEEFEVRYAGFDDGTVVGVDPDDKWDGWN